MTAQEQQAHVTDIVRDYLTVTLGTVVVATGVYFFKYPNHFAMGGVSGISVILGEVIPQVTPSTVAMIINMILLGIALLLFGRKFALKTAYSTVLLSVLLVAMEHFIPLKSPLTDESLLELLLAVALSAGGTAILFNQQASSGGTDIVAMIIRKFIHIDIGMALLVSDLLIVALTFFIFDIKTGLLSLTGLVIKGVVVDSLIANFNRVKYFTIITSKPELIGPYITKNLKRSATRMVARGEYTGQERTVYLSVVYRYQAVKLRDYVKSVDPSSFIMITNTSEIVGRGFHTPF